MHEKITLIKIFKAIFFTEPNLSYKGCASYQLVNLDKNFEQKLNVKHILFSLETLSILFSLETLSINKIPVSSSVILFFIRYQLIDMAFIPNKVCCKQLEMTFYRKNAMWIQ